MAGFDSAAGWLLQVANSADWWCARLPEGGVEEIYADNCDVVIAAAFHPPIAATPVEGGYRVTGRAPLASYIHDADWLMFTATVSSGTPGGTGEAVAVYLRAAEATVIDTWDSLGMRATDSHDVAVEEVFVPAARSFSLVPDFEPGRRYHGPLYRLPGMGWAEAWNTHGPFGAGVDDIAAITGRQNRQLDELCTAAGRDPAGLRRSVLLFEALDPWNGPVGFEDIVTRFAGIGVGEFVLFWPPADHLGTFEQLALEIIPALRAR